MNLTINANDVSSYPALSAIAAGGTTITINGSSSVGVNTATEAITNNTSIVVTVQKAGYNTYSQTISVFDYDMTIEMFLVPTITSPIDGDYQRVYPSYHSYYKPCSLSVYVIPTSSSPVYRTLYYINGVEHSSNYGSQSTIFNVSNPGNFTIGIREMSDFYPGSENFKLHSDVLYQNTNTTLVDEGLSVTDIATALSGDDAANFTVEEYRPSLSLSKTQEPSCEGDECCNVTLGSEITITPNLNLNLTGFTSCLNSTLTYELQDWEGNVLETTVHNIVNADPIEPLNLQFVFTPAIIGDHKVVATLENCCTSCTVEEVISVCDFVKLRFESCNNYSIQNCSLSTDLYFSLTEIDGTVISGPTNALSGTKPTFTTPKDGIYVLKVNKTSDDSLYGNFVVIAYCGILSCITARIQEILCKDCNCNENCKDYCKDRYELNRILPLAALFFNYANKEYTMNRIYSLLDDAKIKELTDVDSVIDKLISYCDSCTTDINDIGNLGTNKDSDCGCN